MSGFGYRIDGGTNNPDGSITIQETYGPLPLPPPPGISSVGFFDGGQIDYIIRQMVNESVSDPTFWRVFLLAYFQAKDPTYTQWNQIAGKTISFDPNGAPGQILKLN